MYLDVPCLLITPTYFIFRENTKKIPCFVSFGVQKNTFNFIKNFLFFAIFNLLKKILIRRIKRIKTIKTKSTNGYFRC